MVIYCPLQANRRCEVRVVVFHTLIHTSVTLCRLSHSHVISSTCREEEEPVKVFRLVLTSRSRGGDLKSEAGECSATFILFIQIILLSQTLSQFLYSWTLERRRFRMNFCQSINSLTQRCDWLSPTH